MGPAASSVGRGWVGGEWAEEGGHHVTPITITRVITALRRPEVDRGQAGSGLCFRNIFDGLFVNFRRFAFRPFTDPELYLFPIGFFI